MRSNFKMTGIVLTATFIVLAGYASAVSGQSGKLEDRDEDEDEEDRCTSMEGELSRRNRGFDDAVDGARHDDGQLKEMQARLDAIRPAVFDAELGIVKPELKDMLNKAQAKQPTDSEMIEVLLGLEKPKPKPLTDEEIIQLIQTKNKKLLEVIGEMKRTLTSNEESQKIHREAALRIRAEMKKAGCKTPPERDYTVTRFLAPAAEEAAPDKGVPHKYQAYLGKWTGTLKITDANGASAAFIGKSFPVSWEITPAGPGITIRDEGGNLGNAASFEMTDRETGIRITYNGPQLGLPAGSSIQVYVAVDLALKGDRLTAESYTSATATVEGQTDTAYVSSSGDLQRAR